MNLETVVRELELDSAATVLEVEWERSQASLPEGELFFLEPQFVARACHEVGTPDEVTAAATAAGRRIAAQPAARSLAWHLHYCLFQSASYARDLINGWPSLDQALAGEGRTLYLLALLSGLPALEQFNAARSVPEEVTRETLSDILRWFGRDEDCPPQAPWGLTPRALSWLILHLTGGLYRLGRLQFEHGPFHFEVVAYRNRESRAVLALSEGGIRYREDGGRATKDTPVGSGVWTSRLLVGQEHAPARQIVGNPICPEGRALREEVTLEAAEWDRVLAPDMPVMHIHIPAGGPLLHDQCGESLRRALEFFPRHFPDRPFHAFCCGSWLLDAELQCLLPQTSNIVRFQREFYLVPIGLSAEYLIAQTLGVGPEELASAPRGTALQRALVDVLSSGQPLRPTGGGCLLFPEDFNWGSQVYLNQRYPW